MQHELDMLRKLLERKKQYLTSVEKQNIRDAIQAEINIMENVIVSTAIKIDSDFQATTQYIKSLETTITQLQQINVTLETICLMHGIDDWKVYLMQGSNYLKSELDRDKKENCVRVPNQLRKMIYG